MAGLHMLTAMVETGQPASQLLSQFTPVPQLLQNVRFTVGQTPLETAPVQAAIRAAETALKGRGRLLIRKSGTEPLIRVMAECEDETLLNATVAEVAAAVQSATS